jgi:hypothetical protein
MALADGGLLEPATEFDRRTDSEHLDGVKSWS